jgi:hypothetical protein
MGCRSGRFFRPEPFSAASSFLGRASGDESEFVSL